METPLKRARNQRNLTQEEVARAVGIKQGFYCRLENGQCGASRHTARKLASFFGIPVIDVLLPEESGTPQTAGEAA